MRTKITIDPFDEQSIGYAIRQLNAYRREVMEKADVLCERLAMLGASRVSIEYSRVGEIVTLKPMPEIEVRNHHGSTWTIYANGEEAVFVEFGSGAKYGYGHPDPMFEPGSYNPDSENWKTGWIYNNQFTYGNAPTAGMWKAKEDIKDNLKRIAEEVFNG